ncbi:RES family NAD+ phosphorylase [Paenarthrobacter sp. PH39-S1]|uniref:RES family NAD+ phosphorylase n=1 Tax=Paenarthrobacter sp. PH39-S1 TaxID=3046204 RepID=UPI0024BA9BBF|nr:RES family NAD+ phosphorylase [Paenarthrobacter sp. PH39-S1]MDJ0355729.1 RES family NAD+ phosphorylase [Paenarthrobacter sp. PH39-S1]
MEFWRVCNWHPDAHTASTIGHPLYRWPRQGAGRIDDPDHEYLVLYLADTQEGAVAEAFGGYASWTQDIFVPPPGAPAGTVKALVRFTGEPDILDLDDPFTLQEWSLRPSSVVARNRPSTQQWSRAMYDAGLHAGISWWSFYEPRWVSSGLWNIDALTIAQPPELLSLEHDSVRDAASWIKRVIIKPASK